MNEQAEYYFLPGTLPEDIRQEMAMSGLTGKKSSMKRLMETKDIGYGVHPIPDAIPVWSIVPRPDFAVMEKLASFIIGQEEGIKREVLAYLSEPDDGRLASIVEALGVGKLEPKSPYTLTELIVRALPAPIEELYQLARGVHHSKKPEAAVRQNIRNMLKRNEVVWEGDVLCPVKDSAMQTRKSYARPGS